MSSTYLKNIEVKQGTRVFSWFALVILALCACLVFSHYQAQRDFLKENFIASGEHLAKITSLQSRSWDFSQSKAKLVKVTEEAFKDDRLLSIVASSISSPREGQSAPVEWIRKNGLEIIVPKTEPTLSVQSMERIVQGTLPFQVEMKGKTEFWMPIFTRSSYVNPESLFFEKFINRSSDMIGFLVLTLSKEQLNFQLRSLLFQHLGAGVFLVLLASFLAYRPAKRMPKARAMPNSHDDLLLEGILHNVQNLSNLVVGNMMILKRNPTASNNEELINEIIQFTRESSQLIKKLRVAEKEQRLEKAYLDIDHRAAIMANIMRPVLGNDITVETRLSPTPIMIWANPVEMDHLVLNLIINAKEAIVEGGVISVTMEERFIDQALPKGRKPGKYAVLTVSDNGVGISEADQKRVFDPFFSTKGKDKGFGLWTASEAVKGADGFIELESELGQGTTFRVFFPLDEPD